MCDRDVPNVPHPVRTLRPVVAGMRRDVDGEPPREVAHFLPEPPEGHSRVSSNDVDVDERGLFYLIDRGRGLHILERA